MSALDELRENLREAARRDIEAKRARSRRRHRRATGLLAAVLLGGAAAAGAADLISVGEPVEDLRVQGDDYKPPPGTLRPTIVATANSGRALPYAVGMYDANNGQRCLVAGSLRGYTLGREQGGRFLPYMRDTVGTCRDTRLANWVTLPDEDRMLVFGRTLPENPMVRVTVEGKTVLPRLQKDGAFLVVYTGPLDRAKIRVTFAAR